jgi:hypothetical protein
MNNCLVWALPRWLRNYMQGEALVIRKSKHSLVPHFMRAPCIHGLQVQEYVPVSPVVKPVPVKAALFPGVVKHGPATCLCEDCRA